MALAKGVAKKLAYKKETNWGELPGASGAQYLRRVTSSFTANAEALQSGEIRTDFQIADYRLSTRSAEGSLNGELSPSAYADFFAAALARNFTSGGTATAEITIALVSGQQYTVTRTAGDWVTDGFYVGNVVRLAGAGLTAGNVSNNLLVTKVEATVLTVQTLGDNALVAEGPIAAVTAAVVGKQTFTPKTGHTSDSFAFEEFFSDVNVSEVYTGCKVGSVNVQLPTNGFATADFSFMGRGLTKTGAVQYFTSPTNATTEGLTVSVSGAVLVNGIPSGVITSCDFSVDRGLEAANVIGSNYAAEIFDGRVNVTGSLSVYMQDAVYRDYYLNEQAISIVVALSTGSEKDAEVLTFVMPRVKMSGGGKSDGETGVVQDFSFQALLNTQAGAGLPETTLLIQDTSLV